MAKGMDADVREALVGPALERWSLQSLQVVVVLETCVLRVLEQLRGRRKTNKRRNIELKGQTGQAGGKYERRDLQIEM